jgi:hypothetical protein
MHTLKSEEHAAFAQVWLPSDKNMAGCDNCSFWVHDHCDPAANVALHAPSDIPFYCAPCKRQAEAHAKLTALRAAEAQLRAAQPRRPRSAYHLFSLELNKCALLLKFSHPLHFCVSPLIPCGLLAAAESLRPYRGSSCPYANQNNMNHPGLLFPNAV